jgi:hypothetical protein
MIDPVSALALATAAFNGVKKAVEIGREVQDVYSQLSTWAGHVGDFHKGVAEMEIKQNRKPGLFDKITFAKSETAEAFDLFAAKRKVIEMEKEIYHMFLYGELNHLGRDGYDEFRKMRQEVKEKREKMIRNQMELRKEFFENIKLYTIIFAIIVIGGLSIWGMVELAMSMG